MTLHCKKKYCHQIQRSENGCNVAEYSKEGYGSKRAVLAVMMMVMNSLALLLSRLILFTGSKKFLPSTATREKEKKKISKFS
jgi:hypothetical protein